jgi:16S rRNA (cytosine1402-N4)-methyltransferase
VRLSRKRLESLGIQVDLFHANYADLEATLSQMGIHQTDGVLLDLGMSSYQIEKSGRGFSFLRDEPLDMRMDTREDLTARHLINTLPRKELERLLRAYGERRANSVAAAVVRAREKAPLESSRQLAELIECLLPQKRRLTGRHPATQTFQSLRIAVNRELENLRRFMERIPPLISCGGRLVILSYHSLEDAIVKQAMANWEKDCACPPDLPVCTCGKTPLFRRLFRKPMKPSESEIRENPRSRSALLRAVERI